MGVADRPGTKITEPMSYVVSYIMADVENMVLAAIEKHASMHSPHEGHSVIREEFEELWDHVKADTGRTPEARKEALQLAAMAVRYIADLIDTEKKP